MEKRHYRLYINKICIVIFTTMVIILCSAMVCFGAYGYGDVNKDGKVDIIDAILSLQYIDGDADLSNTQLDLADLNGDGIVKKDDAALILKRIIRTAISEPDTEGTTETISVATKLTEDMIVDGDLVVSADTDLNGYTLNVSGNLIQPSGTIYINSGKLNISGDYRIQSEVNKGTFVDYSSSTGILKMLNTNDYIYVGGSFYTQTYHSHSGYLTAGTLEVKKDFYQFYRNYTSNFDATGNHKVILSGIGIQNIYFENPDYSGFAVLDIQNKYENIKYLSAVRNINWNESITVDGDLGLTGNANFYGETLTVNGDFNLSNGRLCLNGGNLVVNGDATIGGNGIVTEGGNITVTGLCKISGDIELGGATLDVGNYLWQTGGTVDLAGGIINVPKDFIQSGGTMYLNGGRLNVTGDYRIQSATYQNGTFSSFGGCSSNPGAYLKMQNPNDYVYVGKSFYMQAFHSHNGYLTAGTLEVKKDFYQYYIVSSSTTWGTANFDATGNHKVILSGTGIQNIYFESPSSSGFAILDIQNKYENIKYLSAVRNISWNESITVDGDLGLTGNANFYGETLTVNGDFNLSSGRLCLNGGNLVVNGDATIGGSGIVTDGGNITVTGLCKVSGDIELGGATLDVGNYLWQTSGTVDLAKGTINVPKNFIQSGGTMYLNGGRLNVIGNYRIQSATYQNGTFSSFGGCSSNPGAYLKMQNPNDYVYVGKSFYMQAFHSHNGYLTAGTLEVKKDFYQYYIVSSSTTWGTANFDATGNHKVILSGTGIQNIYFESPSSSGFAGLQMTNTSNNILLPDSMKGIKAYSDITIEKDITLSNTPLYVNGKNVTINGDLILKSDAYITGGLLTIEGDLCHLSGTMNVNKGALCVKGNYLMQGQTVQSDGTVDYGNASSSLKMAYEEDIVTVYGDMVVQSTSKSTLTNGVLEIKGNFTQKTTSENSASSNFYCSDNHVILLNGSSSQTITFESPSQINEYVYSDGTTSISYNRYSQFNYLITDKDISNFNFKPTQEQFLSSNGSDTNYYALIYNSTVVNSDASVTFGRAGVSPASGNYSESFSDLSIATAGVGIDFGRTYNSMDNAESGLMGTGWTFSYSARLESVADDTTTVTLPNGSVSSFKKENGSYKGTNTRSILIDNGNGYTLTNKDQSSYIFNSDGYLTAITDKFGNQVTINVDSNGKITGLIDQSGYTYTIGYTGNYITSITDDNSGRGIRYGYDGDKLVSFTDVMGCVSTFEYDSNGKLCTIKNNDGYVVEALTYITEEGSNKNKVLTKIDRAGNTVTYNYDTDSRCTTMTDSNGRVTKQYYDSCYNITKTIDPEGGIETVSYFLDEKGQSSMGEIRSKTDRNGNTTTNTIDDRGNITKITYPDGSTKQYIYDSKNNVTYETNQAGRKIFYVYDSTGTYLQKVAVPVNTTANYSGDNTNFAVTEYTYYSDGTYKAKGLIKAETSPTGAVKTNIYYNDGTLKSQSTTANGKTITESYTYNSQRLASSYTDGNGNVTKYDYDNRGNIIRESKNGGNSVTRTVYNKNGEKIQEISPKLYNSSYDNISSGTYSNSSVGIRYKYNSDGTLAQQTDANGNVTKYTYDIYGNTLTETQPNGLIYRYVYDNIDRKVKTTADSIGTISTTAYTILSNGNTQTTNVVYIDDTKTATTVQTMDYADRLVSQKNPDGTEIKKSYDKSGLLVSSTDAKNNVTTYTYNMYGLVEQEKKPLEVKDGTAYYSITKYEYDKNGNNTAMYKSNNAVGESDSFTKTEYTYDGFNNMTSVISYDGTSVENIVKYTYDNVGNKTAMYTGLSSNSDTDYATDSYTYDFNGKVLTHTDPMGYTETYSYNANGEMISFKNKNGKTTSYSYDDNGNLTSQRGTDYSYSFGYDSMNNRISADDGNAHGLYTYDKLGRLTSESVSGSSVDYSYDRVGNMLTRSVSYSGNYLQETYTYDDMNRMLTAKGNNGINAAYTYDSNGNRTKLSYGNGVTVDYSYNSGNLIKTINASSSGTTFEAESYNYYTDGNQHTKYITGMSEDKNYVYSYDGLGRIIGVDYNGNVTQYSYDDYNNRISKTIGGTTTSYSYDKNNRLLSEGGITYTYDSNGNMLTKTQNGIKTSYGYDALNRLISVSGDNSCTYTYNYDNQRLTKTVAGLLTSYVYSGGDISAEYNGNTKKNYYYGIDRIGSNTDYYIANAHTDVTAITNTDGDVVRFYNYDEFGNEENISKTDNNPFRYSGEYYDAETGNYYLNNRYYNPASGRFITEDTYLGSDKLSVSLNRYTYCNNNPIMYIDSSGNTATVAQFALGAIKEGARETAKKRAKDSIRTLITGQDNNASADDYTVTFVTNATKGGFSAIGMSDLGGYVSKLVKQGANEYFNSKKEGRKYNVENVAKGTVNSIAESAFTASMTAAVTGVSSTVLGGLSGTAVGLVKDLATEAFHPGSGAISNNKVVKGLTWFTTKSKTAKAYNNYIENEYTSEFAMKHGYRNEFMAVKDLNQSMGWAKYVINNATSKEKLMNYDQWRNANGLKNYKIK